MQARRRLRRGDAWEDVTRRFVGQLKGFFDAWQRDAKRVLEWDRPDVQDSRARRHKPLLPEVAAQTGVPISTLKLEGLFAAIVKGDGIRLTRTDHDRRRAVLQAKALRTRALRSSRPMPVIWWRLEEAKRALFKSGEIRIRNTKEVACMLLAARWDITPKTAFEYHRQGRRS
jgi:hypothetical protein